MALENDLCGKVRDNCAIVERVMFTKKSLARDGFLYGKNLFVRIRFFVVSKYVVQKKTFI